MKNFIALLILSFSGSFVQGHHKTDNTIICGHFRSYKHYSGPIEIYLLNLNALPPNSSTKYIADCRNGYFKIKVQVDHPTYFAIQTNETDKSNAERDICGVVNAFFIHPMIERNDSLYLDIDSVNEKKRNKLDYVDFFGRGSEKDVLIKALFNILERNEYNLFYVPALFNEIKLKCLNVVLSAQATLSPDENLILKADVIGLIDNVMYEYCNRTGISLAAEKKAKEDYLSFIHSTNVQLDDVLQYSAFPKQFLRKKIIFKDVKSIDELPPADAVLYGATFKSYDSLLSCAYKGKLREVLIALPLLYQIRIQNILTGEMDTAVQHFLSSLNPEDEYYKALDTAYTQLKNINRRGSLDFSLIDTLGNVFNLSKYIGKVVLLDFNFTGCGGCKQLVPKLTLLEDQYRDDSNIVLISISTDLTEELFKQGIGIYNSRTNIPLYTGGNSSDDPIIRYYRIWAYPTLVLLDKKGKILKNGLPNDLMTGDAPLKALIDQALAEK